MIRKILLAALLWPLVALAQTFTYPSVTFQDLTVLGTTNVGSVNLGTQAANTVLANATGSSAAPTAVGVPSCNTASSALLWTSGSGFSCNTSINAATLGGVAAGAYAPLASPTFTGTVTIPSGASIAGYAQLASPAFSGTPTAPTATAGTSTTQLATTAFVANSFAPLASPALTGTPTAPNASLGTNTTQLATTAYVAKHAPCTSIIDYGGDPTNTNDNSTALTNALTAATTGGRTCVYFPPGIYAFSSAYSYTIPSGGSITLLGAGPDVTYLYWAANGGLTLNHTGSFASAHIRDMTFLAGTTGGGDAITLNQTTVTIANPANTAPSDITNVTMRGIDGYLQTFYWTDGITVKSVSNINFTNIFVSGPGTAAGNGVQLISTSTAPGVAYNFQTSTFNWNTFGIYYGTYIQGVTVNQCNFTGGNTGLITPNTAVALDQLTVTNSQFNNTSNGIALLENVPATQITGNLFGMLSTGAVGITIQSPGLYEIVGNQFGGNLGTNQKGINLAGPSSSSGVITGNSFYKLPIAINLDATTGGVNVQSNAYNSNTTNVNNLSAGNTVGGGSP